MPAPATTPAGPTVAEAAKAQWHLRDPQLDKIPGTGTTRTYAELLKGRVPTAVVVAVIDSGIDTAHVDLKPVLWRNPREIPGNGIDDDHNGYIDDVHGWNFLGARMAVTSRSKPSNRHALWPSTGRALRVKPAPRLRPPTAPTTRCI
ncbi:S8 family serine peptidase [Hymenobacter sp. BRD67]|uniref:S8 family serine peptidase n=1 Tax=Hymenobacter sp. BRD67 TaxID=2675877 RepID=UPI0020B7C417|nr:S8 family serine peptidase [Hymenobacter sp. BRD67]